MLLRKSGFSRPASRNLFPTSVVEHIFLSFVFGDPVFRNLRQFTRLFRLFLRGQVTRHGFTLIGAPRRICFCPKFLLLLQCFSNPRFLPFLSDRAPVPLHLFRLYLYGSSMPVRVMISRFQQMPRRFGMHVIANQLPGILRGTNSSSDGRKPPIPLLGGGSSSSLFEVVKAFHPSRESIPYLAIVAFFFVLIP